MSIEECTALAKTDAKCKDGEGYFTFGFTQCYCCTTSGATSNPESLIGFEMYQIDLKGYFEAKLCLVKQESLDYNSMAANSKYDCSSKCDADATCAAFVYADSKCSKRLYSDLDKYNEK